MTDQPRSATVSRGAYFLGLLAGAAVLVFGLYGLSQIDVGGWQIPLEMMCVAMAMLLTTGIWKRSASHKLDSPIEPKDRT